MQNEQDDMVDLKQLFQLESKMQAWILIISVCLLSFVSECLGGQSAWYFTPEDVNALHSEPADYRFFYGKNHPQFGDLRLPEGKGPFPVAIIIHGGCWSSKSANAQNTAALADALRDSGIATWNIEYRSEDDKGGGWPGTFVDVANAADFLGKIAGKYSLDLNHVIVVGHSAGVTLALWLAARHQLPQDSVLYKPHPLGLRGIVALDGVVDLKAFRKQAESENACNEDVVGELLGNSPELVSQHYREVSPIELLPLGVPQILIYGAEDQVVPEKFGRAYMQTARKKGDTVDLIVVENAAHHESIVPNSVAWPIVKSAVLSLLNSK